MGQVMVTREWSDWRNRHVWWIQSVYVWPEARKKGVWRALYARVLAEARAAGAGVVRLYVDQRNTDAATVYRKLGMDGGHYQVFEQVIVP
jgi:GNAT superfamily N-acetyltransferase